MQRRSARSSTGQLLVRTKQQITSRYCPSMCTLSRLVNDLQTLNSLRISCFSKTLSSPVHTIVVGTALLKSRVPARLNPRIKRKMKQIRDIQTTGDLQMRKTNIPNKHSSQVLAGKLNRASWSRFSNNLSLKLLQPLLLKTK